MNPPSLPRPTDSFDEPPPPTQRSPVALDEIVHAAQQGDRRAIAAIGIAFGPFLCAAVRVHVARTSRSDSGDLAHQVLAALFDAMASGALEEAPAPRPGGALQWLERQVRRFVRAAPVSADARTRLTE